MSRRSPFRRGVLLAGRYRILRRINRGGMGDIYLAQHERTAAKLIVKALSPTAATVEAVRAFEREAGMMKRVRHPNVVKLVDFGWQEGLPFLVMEYLPGKELADVLSSGEPLAAERVISIVKQVASGLDAAHRAGIVHRDVKPKNVIIVPRHGKPDVAKVIDFGASKVKTDPVPQQTDMVIGTPEFMSPELAEGREADVEYRSDLFALATLSYSLLTRRTPWRSRHPDEVMSEVASLPPLPVDKNGKLPAVEKALLRGMAKSPEHRYATTIAFAKALERAMTADGLLTRRRRRSRPARNLSSSPTKTPRRAEAFSGIRNWR
jgi:eukaryotic-like serine/threonine-protein kinase